MKQPVVFFNFISARAFDYYNVGGAIANFPISTGNSLFPFVGPKFALLLQVQH